jgi:hypothetical protein
MGEPHTGHYPRECSSTKMHITIGSSFIKKKRTAALKESSFAVVPCPSVICLRLRSGFSICICPHGADDFLSYIFFYSYTYFSLPENSSYLNKGWTH